MVVGATVVGATVVSTLVGAPAGVVGEEPANPVATVVGTASSEPEHAAASTATTNDATATRRRTPVNP